MRRTDLMEGSVFLKESVRHLRFVRERVARVNKGFEQVAKEKKAKKVIRNRKQKAADRVR